MKAARQRAGLGQKDLAAKAKVYQSTVARYEGDKRKELSAAHLAAIAAALGVSVEYLQTGKESRAVEASVHRAETPFDAAEIFFRSACASDGVRGDLVESTVEAVRTQDFANGPPETPDGWLGAMREMLVVMRKRQVGARTVNSDEDL